MRINHNIPALRTLHQMGRVNNNIDKSMQRLSSGLRINSAADDAAGLAIAQKMDTQVRGLKQANRNAMDGISLIQTAEGALNEVHNMLQRVRELSIQASNGTLTPSDRKAITDEVAQLKSEIDRISEHIEYNERKLLNGEIDRRAFSDKETVANVVSMSDGVNPGDYQFQVTKPATQTAVISDPSATDMFDADGKSSVAGTININGEQVEITKDDDAQTLFAKIRNLCDTVGIDLSVDTAPFGNSKKLVFISREYGDNKDIDIKGSNELLVKLGLSFDTTDATANAGKVFKGTNVEINATSISGYPSGTTYKVTNGNIITFEGNNGFRLVVESAKTTRDSSTGALKTQPPLIAGTPNTPTAITETVKLSLLETGPLDLQIGANEGQMMQLRIQNMSTAALGLSEMNLNTSAKSQEAITLVDAAIAQVSSTRSKLGAYQNRLEHTVANLDVAAENMTASMSRIQDADMASEMSEFTKDNIISQAGTAMLAQANQRPQQILQLLQR